MVVEWLALSIGEGLALSIGEGLALSIGEGLALSIGEGLALSDVEGRPVSCVCFVNGTSPSAFYCNQNPATLPSFRTSLASVSSPASLNASFHRKT